VSKVEDVARGPGPAWLRATLAVLAGVYYVLLVKHPPPRGPLRSVAFFTECTCLFPTANDYRIEYRLDAWSCGAYGWRELDPRPFFPIEADDKESRFQRLGHFYQQDRSAMQALEAHILTHHPEVTDGVDGPIGGIRLFKTIAPLPAPGQPVERYIYRPLELPADAKRRDLYWTPISERRARCGRTP